MISYYLSSYHTLVIYLLPNSLGRSIDDCMSYYNEHDDDDDDDNN